MPPPSNTAPASSPLSAVGEQALTEIERILREELELDLRVTPESHLVRDLELDSLGLLTIAVGLENRFRVHLREEDSTWVSTAGDLARLVQTRIEERSP